MVVPPPVGRPVLDSPAPRAPLFVEPSSRVVPPQQDPPPPQAAANRAPVPLPSDPWSRLQRELTKLGGGAGKLAEGRPRLDGDLLRVEIPAGRTLAEARAVTAEPGVVEAVHRIYGPRASIEAVAQPGTGSAQEQASALKRQVLANPEVQRIVNALGGEIHRVIAHEE